MILLFTFLCLLSVTNSQATVDIINGYSPTVYLGTNYATTKLTSSGPFTGKLIEVLHYTLSGTQIDTYLQVVQTGQIILPSNTKDILFRSQFYTVHFLNANTSLSYKLFVNSQPGITGIGVIVGSSDGTYDLSVQNNLYKAGNVQLWWFITAFLGFNAVFFIFSFFIISISVIIIAKRKGNPALKNEISVRKCTYTTIMIIACLSMALPYGITVASPFIWRLPYAYTCCNYFAREGGDRCYSNPTGLGLTPPDYSCFYDQFTQYTYMENTWFMILSSYLLGFCLFLPCFICYWYGFIQCIRLFKATPKFEETTTIEVKAI